MGGTVLVVDDSAVTRSLIAEVCATAGASAVESCGSGFEAMRALPRVDDLALVITDVNMPDITGLELVRMLREQERYRKVPIFVVSTDSASSDFERAIALGANKYFTKPFDLAALGAAVKGALET